MTDTAGNITSGNGNAVCTAVECTDAKGPTSWRKRDRDNTALHAKYPFLTWSNAWMNLPCATWGVPQRTPLEAKAAPHQVLPKVLIVQSTSDAATPYEGAVELHRSLKGSRIIIEKGAGSHGVPGLVTGLVNTCVTACLVEGKPDGKDVVCARHAPHVPATS